LPQQSRTGDKQRAKNKRKKSLVAEAAGKAGNDFVSPNTSIQPAPRSQQDDTGDDNRARKKRKTDLLAQAAAEASIDYSSPSLSNQLAPAPSRKPTSPLTGSQDRTPQIPSHEATQTLDDTSREAEENQILKQKRRDRRVAIIATYDVRSNHLPPGWNPGKITLGEIGLEGEGGYHASQPAVTMKAVSKRASLQLLILMKTLDSGEKDTWRYSR
jgi:hypothetical protein